MTKSAKFINKRLIATQAHSPIMNSSSLLDDQQCNGHEVLDMRFATEDALMAMLYNQVDKYMILILFSIICLLGCFGNCVFLLSVAFIAEMRTKTNFYLANLAIADLIFISGQFYDVLLNYLISPRLKTMIYHSSLGCGFLFTSFFTGHFATVGFIFLVALERYLAICQPLQHRKIVSKGRTVKLVTTTWILGLVYAAALIAPRWFVVHKVCILWPNSEEYNKLPTILTNCIPIHPAYNAFPFLVQSFPFYTALFACIFMYSRIIKKLNERVPGTTCKDQSAGFDLKAKKVRNQVARLLVVNTVVYFMFHIVHFTQRVNDAVLLFTHGEIGVKFSDEVWYILHWFNRALGTMNSCVNPMIYAITNSKYREAFWAILSCRISSLKRRNSNSKYS